MFRPLLSTSLPSTLPQSKKEAPPPWRYLHCGSAQSTCTSSTGRTQPLSPVGSESVQVDDWRNTGQLRDLSPERVVEENKDICFGEGFLKGMSEGLHMKNVTQDAKFAFNKTLLRKFPMSLAWEN